MSTLPERLKSGARRTGALAISVEKGIEAASGIAVEVRRVIANIAVSLHNINEQSQKLDTIIERLDKLDKIVDNRDKDKKEEIDGKGTSMHSDKPGRRSRQSRSGSGQDQP